MVCACGKTEVSGTSVTGGPSAALPLEAACVTVANSFQKGSAPVFAPLALPAGAYQVHVETNDAGHQPGKETDQIEEVVTVWGVGTTQDIPEAATRQVTTFSVVLPKLAQIVVESGPHSVHGVCVVFVRT